MRERDIERRFVAAVKKESGMAPKFTSPSQDGFPDRLALLPEGRIAFVEVKAAGKAPRALQLLRHEQLRRLGFKVYVLDRAEQIKQILEDMHNG
jgi:hypothetical protein